MGASQLVKKLHALGGIAHNPPVFKFFHFWDLQPVRTTFSGGGMQIPSKGIDRVQCCKNTDLPPPPPLGFPLLPRAGVRKWRIDKWHCSCINMSVQAAESQMFKRRAGRH